MSTGFDDLIDRANRFFTELAANNSRDWFEQRKAYYTGQIRKPAELLAGLLAEDISRLTGVPHAPKLFRIYRDVRFSKDKTPYNPHLHMMWRPDARDAPGWFFGAAPSYLILGTGLMTLQGNALTRYRAHVDRDGAALAAAIEGDAKEVGADISDWGPPPLKRVPKPYAPDHPQADLLRRKALAITAALPPTWRDTGLVDAIGTLATALKPVWSELDRTLAG